MAKSLPFDLPTAQDFLKAGVQFGHESKRWNPKMKNFIFGSKKGIHVIDLEQTVSKLEDAARFLIDASREGSVLFVGTKRQAADIVREKAVEAGAYFITHRWAGGLLTNFSMITQSIGKLNSYENQFESGVEGRTKYEVSKMKAEWERLNRLYGGIKGMRRMPTAIVVVDTRYEIGAVAEANKLGIPVIGIVDTNSDPNLIDYPIPANDDALGSIGLIMDVLAKSVKAGNGGQGVTHNLVDYSNYDVKLIKKSSVESISEAVSEAKNAPKRAKTTSKPKAKIRIKKKA